MSDTAKTTIFHDSLKQTLINEGFYSNDHVDIGGETFCGISRVYHPHWPGWRYIDGIDKSLLDCDNIVIQSLVESFYFDNFWVPIRGEKLAETSPLIAEKVFDTAVNLSPGKAVEILQDALNLLNINGTIYKDMLVDGLPGPVTFDSLEKYMMSYGGRGVNEHRLLKLLGHLQAGYYVDRMRKYPEREKFRGWLDRA